MFFLRKMHAETWLKLNWFHMAEALTLLQEPFKSLYMWWHFFVKMRVVVHASCHSLSDGLLHIQP